MANRKHHLAFLADIPPMIGPCGDDLLLRAIHAGMMDFLVLDSDDYVKEAVILGLVRRCEQDPQHAMENHTLLKTTNAGALYWQSRGGDFAQFMGLGQSIGDFAYKGAAEDIDQAPTPGLG